jgi:NADH-quinone oxidoreductase subunit K
VHVGLTHYLFLSAILFSFGVYAVVTRRNAILLLMGIELILNAANVNFIAFARYGGLKLDGQVFAVFVIILAAAEAAIALAIVLNIYQRFKTVNVDEINALKEAVTPTSSSSWRPPSLLPVGGFLLLIFSTTSFPAEGLARRRSSCRSASRW